MRHRSDDVRRRPCRIPAAWTTCLALAAAGAPGPVPAFAQDEPRRVEASGREFVTPVAQKSIDDGLRFLSVRQQDDGALGSGSVYRKSVAVTALGGMAFLAGGHTPGRGKYGANVEKAVGYVLSRSKPNGFLAEESSVSHGPMYDHGFATLFLAETYGMSPRKEVRDRLEAAVRLVVDSQNKEGGWRYHPGTKDADLSVTVCQMMALRAARNAGIVVPKETVDRCTTYVRSSQNPDGGFRYQLVRNAESAFPRSAAGCVALYNAGIFEGREIDRGLAYLLRHVPDRDEFRYESHYYYGHYYAVQAMWHAGGDRWRRWYPAIRDELVARQAPNGGWTDGTICNEYAAAMACLVLQMPNNYLPIFQR